MNKQIYILVAGLLLAMAIPSQAQLLSGFGSSQLNPVTPALDFTAPGWLATQGTENTNNLTVTSISDSSGGYQQALGPGGDPLTSQVTLNDNNPLTLKLLLTGELTAPAPSGSFQITLFDSTFGNTYQFTYLWSSFSQSQVETIAAGNPTEVGTFNGTVGGIQLSVGGVSGETVSFQFDSLTAVPEPSTYAMFAFGAVMLYGLHLRRKARVS